MTRKSTVNESEVCYAGLNWCFSTEQRSCDLVILFFLAFTNGDFLINVNLPYKRISSTLFSELLLCPLFLKIILMSKRHIVW